MLNQNKKKLKQVMKLLLKIEYNIEKLNGDINRKRRLYC